MTKKAGDAVENFFNNKTHNARIELRHQPIGRLKGSWGVQYLGQKSSALSAIPETVQQPMLIDNNVRHYSFFGVEQANWDNFTLEGGVRVEKQKASIQYDKALIDRETTTTNPCPTSARTAKPPVRSHFRATGISRPNTNSA